MKLDIDFSSIRTVRVHKEQFDAIDSKANIVMITCQEDGRVIGFDRIEDRKESKEERKHGCWMLLDECANEGVYCSVCTKKVYKTHYANQKLKSKYCPNCGAIMDMNERKL